MSFKTLISTGALTLHLDDPAFTIVDCRYKLDDVAWGEREYEAAHVPGAVYAHLEHDLSGPKTGTNGRHPWPHPRTAAQTLGRLGIASGIQVVAYDQDNGMYASRLWWLLRWLGHDAVAVLDGGFARWIKEERPTAGGKEQRPARDFSAAPRPDMVVDVDRVASILTGGGLKRGEWKLVDARSPERFRGETEPLDKTPGHIPGAMNHFFQWNVDERGSFRSPEELRERLRASVGDVEPARIIAYCGSGVTACHNLLALEHSGLTGAKLYPGSWSEWSADPARPVERG